MRNEKMFEVAVRNKLRFPFKGVVSVEDLWDLSVEDLDLIFKRLDSEVEAANKKSLLNKKTSEDEILDIKIEIVKYIVSIKLEEENKRLQAKEKREQKQKILAIMAEKQDADLQNKSLDELKEMLAGLED